MFGVGERGGCEIGWMSLLERVKVWHIDFWKVRAIGTGTLSKVTCAHRCLDMARDNAGQMVGSSCDASSACLLRVLLSRQDAHSPLMGWLLLSPGGSYMGFQTADDRCANQWASARLVDHIRPEDIRQYPLRTTYPLLIKVH